MAGVSSLFNTYYRLSKGYEQVTFPQRHNPYSEFRKLVSKLESDAKGLFDDTMVDFSYASSFSLNLIVVQTTTVPGINNMGFEPENPGCAVARPSSTVSQDTTSSPDADGALPCSRNIFVY
jgi:hypothetical protein